MKLKKILYGLGCSGENWYQTYTGFLQELEFLQAGEEGRVFHINNRIEHKLVTNKGAFNLTLAVYVDDSIMSFDNLSAYTALIAKLNENLEISHEEHAK